MSNPTRLKKMHLNSVDFVQRGANPEAHIMLHKSADYQPDDGFADIAKAEDVLPSFTDILGESFLSIAKDYTLTAEEKREMIAKSVNEFVDTMDGYLSSLDILEKSEGDYLPDDYYQTAEDTFKSDLFSKGEEEMFNYENVDKSLLTPTEAATLEALIAKAQGEEFDDEPAGKVNPAKAQKEMFDDEEELPPAVKKALAEVETMKKTYEMKELENVAKKYEVLGKKAPEEAQVLYDLKKSGEKNYNAYIAAMDAQVDMVEKSGLFAEIGKSGSYNYGPVAKSEPETKIESIAKSYMESDPALDYNMAVAKAWENNPQLMAEYEASF